MSIAQRRRLSRLDQSGLRVLPDGLQQSVVPVRAGPIVHDDQRLVDKPCEEFKHVAIPDGTARTDRLGRLERPATGKDRQAREQEHVRPPSAGRSSSPPSLRACGAARRRSARPRRASGIDRAAVRGSDRPTGPSPARPRARWPAARRPVGGRSRRLPSRSPGSLGSGVTAAARTANSRRASNAEQFLRASPSESGGSSSGGTRQTASPGTFSASRLVARIRRLGAARSSHVTKVAHASIRCSQLSRMSNRSRGRNHSPRRVVNCCGRFLRHVECTRNDAREEFRICDRRQVDEPCPMREGRGHA